jgi:hypothetical protein
VLFSIKTDLLKKSWRYQRGNQNPYIREERIVTWTFLCVTVLVITLVPDTHGTPVTWRRICAFSISFLSPTATSCSTNGPHWPFSPSTINCCKLNNGQTTLLKDLNFHYIRVQSKFKYCIVGIYYLIKPTVWYQKRTCEIEQQIYLPLKIAYIAIYSKIDSCILLLSSSVTLE